MEICNILSLDFALILLRKNRRMKTYYVLNI